MALAELSDGSDPSRVVNALLDTLLPKLRPAFLCVRMNDSVGDRSLEMIRVTEPLERISESRDLGTLLDRSLRDAAPKWPLRATVVIGGAGFHVACAGLGVNGEIGVLVAGSERHDFPNQTERLLLDVAATQATIGLWRAGLVRPSEGLGTAADEALVTSDRQFRVLVETIPALVWRGTPEGELDYLNQRAVEYLGHTAETLAGGRWLELVHPDHRDATVRRWIQSATTGSSYDDVYKLRRADGQYRWIQSVGEPLRDSEGRIAHWYGLVIDIEDRKQAEDELRRSEAFLAEGQRVASIGTFTWRWDTGQIVLSDELRRMYELEPGEASTFARLSAVIHPDDMPLLVEKMEQIRVDHAPYEHDFRLRMPDGRVKYLRTVGHALLREDGHFDAVGATQDVTQRRLADEALDELRSELAHVTRVMSLGALTASIAHEVNQPLLGIVTNASTCLRMLDADPPNVAGAREVVRRIGRDGNRAADVITRLRALFGKKDFTPESLDLNEAAREVVALSMNDLQRNRVVVQLELADDLPNVTGDRVQLQQVFLNLIRNATDAMVDVHDRPRQLLITTERDEADRVRVNVRDTGVGLDVESRDMLFDSFFTTKPGGMGIGLSVSRSIVERHRGRLWAESNDGPGATFSFSLPC